MYNCNTITYNCNTITILNILVQELQTCICIIVQSSRLSRGLHKTLIHLQTIVKFQNCIEISYLPSEVCRNNCKISFLSLTIDKYFNCKHVQNTFSKFSLKKIMCSPNLFGQQISIANCIGSKIVRFQSKNVFLFEHNVFKLNYLIKTNTKFFGKIAICYTNLDII